MVSMFGEWARLYNVADNIHLMEKMQQFRVNADNHRLLFLIYLQCIWYWLNAHVMVS